MNLLTWGLLLLAIDIACWVPATRFLNACDERKWRETLGAPIDQAALWSFFAMTIGFFALLVLSLRFLPAPA